MTVLQKIKKSAHKMTPKEVKELQDKNRKARQEVERLGGYTKLAQQSVLRDLPEDVKKSIYCD